MRKNTYTAKIKMAYLIIGPCITALRSKLRTLQKAERGEGGRDVGKRDRGRAVQGSNGGVTGLCKAHTLLTHSTYWTRISKQNVTKRKLKKKHQEINIVQVMTKLFFGVFLLW